MKSALPAALLCAISTPAMATSVAIKVQDANGQPLRDAVVSIQSASPRPGSAAKPSGQVQVSQKDIQFDPHVVVVQKGTTVSFPNRDRVRHQVYSFSKPKRFELKLYGREESRTVQFDVPGTVALGCNIHDQMRAFIRVVDTPWAGKTDAKGQVSLDGLPAGAATITVWHPLARARNGEFVAPLALPASGTVAKVITLKTSAK
jgi:plastocyanin